MAKVIKKGSTVKKQKSRTTNAQDGNVILPDWVIGCYNGASDSKLSEKEGFEVNEQVEATAHT